ncbi:piggyBac transposable element-derived protein 3-like [Ischnura elegans]|uniref:piggyBac transposable element-derived protein 3-like n=1 Tax=Ischnura elegans TaxID=197161 RepID=UPI001ED888C5|nr:piggyBac transposable element-derived protein 3-like [Ischnura elegans]
MDIGFNVLLHCMRCLLKFFFELPSFSDTLSTTMRVVPCADKAVWLRRELISEMASTSSTAKDAFNINDAEHIKTLIGYLEDPNDSEIEGLDSDDTDADEQLSTSPQIPGTNGDGDDQYEDEIEIPALSDGQPENEELLNFGLSDKANITWKRQKYNQAIGLQSAIERRDKDDVEVGLPLEYFSRYISSDQYENMAEKTNMYALQKGKSNFKPTNKTEIEKLVGMHIIMGSLNLPRVRLYWDKALGISVFHENMTRDRFFSLRSNLHVVNNLSTPTICHDKLFKVRPLLDSVRKRCLELQMESNICVDEQMVPFKGKLSLKQYMKGKPSPWGIKIFVLCGQSGLCYDFLVYQGATTEIEPEYLKRFGLGASVVLQLTKRIKTEGHFLYFDNYFSSFHLFEALKVKKIFAAGTVRTNRFGNPPLHTDKELGKRGRGSYDELVSSESNIVLVKWYDNKSVVLASNFVGVEEMDEVRRWNKKQKKFEQVARPAVVRYYNHSMGGVDKLNQLISFYRIHIKSKKWTLRMLFHAIDIAVVNSWLEYKQDNAAASTPRTEVLDLLHFRLYLANSLISANKIAEKNKRGRPSSSPKQEAVTKKNKVESRPYQETQKDLVDHFPEYDDIKEATRCKAIGCRGKTHVFCVKCNVNLCFVKGRNSFELFHH